MNNTTKKKPDLRFKEFSTDLMKMKFDEIYSFRSTNSLSRDKLNYHTGKVKNIHYGDIHTKFQTTFDITRERVPFINEDINISKISDDNYCKEKDLVIADASENYSDIGKSIELINLNEEKLVAGLHTFVARPDLFDLAKGFGAYFMQSYFVRKQIMVIAQGTKVLGISTKRLGKVNLVIPEKDEQKKIATFLTSIDTRIQQLTKKKELLEAYKKGVMQKIFSQEVRFKDNKREYFEDWKVSVLGDLAIKVKVKNSNNKFDFVLTNSATRGIVSQKDYFNKDIANQNNLEGYYIVEKDDFVYNPRISLHAPVGPMKRNHLCKGVMSPLYTVLKFKEGDLDFFEYFFETSVWHKYMKAVANYGVRYDRMNVSNSDLLKMPILLPCHKEQKKIVDFLKRLDAKVITANNSLKELKTYKKGLLQKMFI